METYIFERWRYFLQLICEHYLISFTALSLVTFFGILIGIWVFYSPKARTVILPTINFLYTIPTIAMFGILIPIVGIGLKNALFVLVMYGLLPIVRNTYTGFREVSPQLIETARGMGSTRKQIFRNIYFPLALPSILSGLRVTTVMVIAIVSLAALIGAGGLGQAIFRGLNTMNTPLIVTGSLFISAFAIAGDKFVGTLEKNNRIQKIITHNASKKDLYKTGINLSLLIIGIIASILYLSPSQNNKNGKIVIASKPTSEQFILGEIMAQAIENNTDINVIRNFGIGGGTTNIHPAMLAGKIDIYPEYTSTAWLSVLKRDNSVVDLKNLEQSYNDKFNLKWTGLFGFNNAFTIAITQQTASKENIQTFSDLAKVSSKFDFGAEFDFFEREDGYKGLIKVYPFKFRRLHEMDINLRYKAIEEKKINCVDAFTTDAQLIALKLKTLKDNKHYFSKYQAGIIVRNEILKKYPEIEKILSSLNGKIDNKKMSSMNYEVEIQKKSPQKVAAEFLKTIKFKNDEK